MGVGMEVAAPANASTTQGQLDPRVAYYIQGRDKSIYFTPKGVTYGLEVGGFDSGIGGER